MKILYLTNIPSPYRNKYFNELGKKCDLTVLFERKSYVTRDKSWNDYKFENFKGIFLNGWKLGKYHTLSFEFVRYLKSRKYDYIIVTNIAKITGILAICWMRLHSIPYCIEGDGGFAGSGVGLKEKLKKFLISNAKICFSTSKIHDAYYMKYGAFKENIYRYPFSSLAEEDIMDKLIADSEKIYLKKQLGIEEKRIILSVGSFIPRKGMDILIKAVNELESDWGVYIVGGKPTEEYLELQRKYFAERLHFIEFMKSDRLKEYFKAADIFVLATREDIWGLVINEAMAHALPVITTNRCIAGTELVEDGKNGFLIEVDDIHTLSKKIEILQKSEEVLRSFAENALQTSRRYTIEKMVDSHMKVFEEMSCHL